MSEQTTQSRRAVLAAAAGAVGAVVVQAVGRPTPIRAGEGQAILVGGEYTAATSVTKIASTANIVVLEARNGSTGAGLRAHSNGGTAIQASSNNLTPAVRPDTTIYGFHPGSALGTSPVVARFEAREVPPSLATAIALQVIGKTQFSKSGVATVLAGHSSVVVNVSQISAGSFALATLQELRSNLYVAAVTRQIAASTITIVLNRTVTTRVTVGWMVSESPV